MDEEPLVEQATFVHACMHAWTTTGTRCTGWHSGVPGDDKGTVRFRQGGTPSHINGEGRIVIYSACYNLYTVQPAIRVPCVTREGLVLAPHHWTSAKRSRISVSQLG